MRVWMHKETGELWVVTMIFGGWMIRQNRKIAFEIPIPSASQFEDLGEL